MRYGRRALRGFAVCAIAAGMFAATSGPALADRNQDVAAAPEAVPGDRTADAAPRFDCAYVGTKIAHTKRKAPIRKGMSSRAPIKTIVKKGRTIRYNYTCVSSKGTSWVKTTSPARGYLFRAHI
ncbi:hypothetical protein AB0B50_06865 [Streptomyces sp. NPDC041068]|uniref:hypothetical protein n=1 Tax=Streptomyces sp. NPDC041068 TaxID=3155130 RepID=UPI0033E8D98C